MTINIFEAGATAGMTTIPEQFKYQQQIPAGFQQCNPMLANNQILQNMMEVNKLNNNLERLSKHFEKFFGETNKLTDTDIAAMADGAALANILFTEDGDSNKNDDDKPSDEESNGYNPECECCCGDCSKCDKTEESMEPKDENVEPDTQVKQEPPTDVQNNTVNDEVEPECQNQAKPVEMHEIGSVINLPYDGEVLSCLVVDSNTKYTEVFSLDCIGTHIMNENDTNKGGFDTSDLKKWLNDEILSKFPKSIRDRLVAYSDGSFIRIPTEKQVFGENKYGVVESEDVKQFEPMKNIRNRVAVFTDEDGDIYFKWYWLENPNKDHSTLFCHVNSYGYADYYDASNSLGVRLRFRIANR